MKRTKVSWPAVGAFIALAHGGSPPRVLMAGAAPDSPAARVDSNTAQSLFAGVGSVVVNGSPLSGVVIAGQYVLTAGHVVAGQPVSAIHFALNQGGAQWVSAVTAALRLSELQLSV